MVNYNDAVSIVIATLNQYQYSQRIIKMNRRCYSELSAVLSDQNTDFSLSIAFQKKILVSIILILSIYFKIIIVYFLYNSPISILIS